MEIEAQEIWYQRNPVMSAEQDETCLYFHDAHLVLVLWGDQVWSPGWRHHRRQTYPETKSDRLFESHGAQAWRRTWKQRLWKACWSDWSTPLIPRVLNLPGPQLHTWAHVQMASRVCLQRPKNLLEGQKCSSEQTAETGIVQSQVGQGRLQDIVKGLSDWRQGHQGIRQTNLQDTRLHRRLHSPSLCWLVCSRPCDSLLWMEATSFTW